MKLTIDSLKKTIKKLGYVWYEDRPNIIGIRSNIDLPDIFNDYLCVVWKTSNQEQLKIYLCTTDPGVYYQKKLLNSQGCAIIEPQQAVDSYSLGYHQGRDGKKINPKTDKPYPIHTALVLTGDIKIKRDKDLDGKAGNSGVVMSGRNTGCNIHGTQAGLVTKTIGPWSAGCQVIAYWKDKEEFISILQPYKTLCKNRFTYTLILEKDLVL